ncbi:MAG TPA: hypothetical protein VF579_04520, partial [Candidatus Methylomirabilis sp.]
MQALEIRIEQPQHVVERPDLAVVHMAGEHQADAVAGGDVESYRLMVHQDRKRRRRGRAAKHALHHLRVGAVIDADDPYVLESDRFIAQPAYRCCREHLPHVVKPGVGFVIAGSEHDRGGEPLELCGTGAGGGVGIIEQIAGDEDEIGLEAVGLCDDVGECRGG